MRYCWHVRQSGLHGTDWCLIIRTVCRLSLWSRDLPLNASTSGSSDSIVSIPDGSCLVIVFNMAGSCSVVQNSAEKELYSPNGPW